MPLIKNPYAPGYVLTDDPDEIQRLKSVKPKKEEVDVEAKKTTKKKKKDA